jgi:hypothetical protein
VYEIKANKALEAIARASIGGAASTCDERDQAVGHTRALGLKKPRSWRQELRPFYFGDFPLLDCDLPGPPSTQPFLLPWLAP